MSRGGEQAGARRRGDGRRMSLRARVALAASGSVALVLAVVGFTLVSLVSRDQRRAVDRRLQQQAQALDRPVVVRALLRVGTTETDGALGRDSVVRLLDDEGAVRTEAGDLPGAPFPAPSGPGLSTVDVGGQDWRVLTLAVDAPAPGTVGQVAISLEEQEATLTSLRRRLVALSLVAFVGAGVGGWALGGRALRPLARLRAAAGDVTGGAGAGRRVPDRTGAEEVDELARTLNRMLGRLETALGGERAAAASAREFAANAAHELRTPMTALSANLDVLGREDLDPAVAAAVLQDVRADARRLAEVLGALEQLARAELEPAGAAQDVEVGELVEAAVADARRRHPHAAFALTIASPVAAGGRRADDGDSSPTVLGWPQGLRVLCDNLLDNAACHGRHPPGGAVVDVRVDEQDGDVVLVVADAGPGIPEGEREAVRGRFVRGTGARVSGSGLGLALVEQQVRLHRGSLRIDDAPAGGCRITISLPAASAPR